MTGATGNIGSRLAGLLRRRGAVAVPASRRPRSGGMAMDLTDPDSISAAAAGCAAAFLVTPLGPDESAIGLEAVQRLRGAGVRKIVCIGIMNLEAMAEIPHFAAKLPIKQAVLADGASTVLEPNFFFQNDLMVLNAIKNAGVYPMPVGDAGVWSVDAGDIALAAANALLCDDWAGRPVPICGPERLTGPSMAETWSNALGRPVVYPGNEIGPFLNGLERAMPGFNAWFRNDFEIMMQVTQRAGCPATAAQRAASASIIGQPPRPYADFVEGMAGA